MNKRLPEIFKNDRITKEGNNKNVFYSFDKEPTKEIFKKEFEIIFNTLVEIKTKDKSYIAKIVSKINDHILTNHNQYIKLKDILEINQIKKGL